MVLDVGVAKVETSSSTRISSSSTRPPTGNVAEISRRTGLQRTHVRKYLRLHGLREPRPV